MIGHSVIAGNTVHPFMGAAYEHDIFTGSLLHFESLGYNRIGVIDFSQILVPVGDWFWNSLNRKHYPNADDRDGVVLGEVIDLGSGITHSDTILSTGVDAPNPAVLHYQPRGHALDKVPTANYDFRGTYAQYRIWGAGWPFYNPDNFLEAVLERIEAVYGPSGFAGAFTADFESFLAGIDLDPDTAGNQPYTDPDGDPILTLADTQRFGPAETWPKMLSNYPYIEFWHRLDAALHANGGMGPELLGEAAWTTLFQDGIQDSPYQHIVMDMVPYSYEVEVEVEDQTGMPRPANTLSDIGAYEHFSLPCAGDFSGGSEDGDVDSADLAEMAANLSLLDLLSFAAEFGRTDCPID